MRIEAKSGFTEFVLDEVDSSYVAYTIQVQSGHFTGRASSVLFSYQNLADFLSRMETLEKTRLGEVVLEGVSFPSDVNGFQFKIASVDKLGHLAIFIQLRETIYLNHSPSPFRNMASVVFEIEPDTLPTILKDFKKLFSLT